MARGRVVSYWFGCDDPSCDECTDQNDGPDGNGIQGDSFAQLRENANAAGWYVYADLKRAFCPKHYQQRRLKRKAAKR